VGAFEMPDTVTHDTTIPVEQPRDLLIQDRRKVKDECIVAYKVYDSCRRQNCLTPRELGPSRAAGNSCVGEHAFREGDIIQPPKNATTVSMDNVKIRRIHVVDKQPCPFRTGFWDISIKYVFEYRLTFREVGGHVIGHVDANSFFNMKATLFGSVGSGLVIEKNHTRRHLGDSPLSQPQPNHHIHNHIYNGCNH
jgi:hypothetical protein